MEDNITGTNEISNMETQTEQVIGFSVGFPRLEGFLLQAKSRASLPVKTLSLSG